MYENPKTIEAEIRAILHGERACGIKIELIKLHRCVFDSGLKEAKEEVEMFLKNEDEMRDIEKVRKLFSRKLNATINLQKIPAEFIDTILGTIFAAENFKELGFDNPLDAMKLRLR